MTDARYPDRWLTDRRFLRLTRDAHLTLVMLIVWSVSNRTDGHLDEADLELIPKARPGDVDELIRSGLLARDDAGLHITIYEDTQTTAAQLLGLEHQRRSEREKKARQRAHARGDHSLCRPDTCTTVPGDNRRDRTGERARDTKDRQGQARTGINSSGSLTGRTADESDEEWP